MSGIHNLLFYLNNTDDVVVMFRIVEDDMPPLPEDCSPLLRDFLTQCFSQNPDQRSSAEVLCEHEWLKELGRSQNNWYNLNPLLSV